MTTTPSNAPGIMAIGAHAVDGELIGGASVLAHRQLRESLA